MTCEVVTMANEDEPVAADDSSRGGVGIDREPPSDVPSELELLVRDYEQAAEEGRAFRSQIATILGIGFTIAAGAGAYLDNTCRPQGSTLLDSIKWITIEFGNENPSSCRQVSDYLLAAVPTLPVLLLSIAVVQGTVATVRSYYLRTLEVRIRSHLPNIDDRNPVPYGTENLGQTFLSQARSPIAYRFLNVVQWAPAAALAIGLGIMSIGLMPVGWVSRTAAVTYLLMATGLIYGVTTMSQRGSRIWHSACGRFAAQMKRAKSDFPSETEKINIRYIALPRPSDVIAKAPIHAFAFTISSAVVGGTIDGWRIFWFTIVLELVVYQARYVVNDLRDRNLDHKDSYAGRRMRLGPDRSDFNTALLAIAVRAVALIVAWFSLDEELRPTLATSTTIVVAAAVVYEYGRTLGKRTKEADRKRAVRIVIATVGIGYGLRVGAGFHLGGLDTLRVGSGAIFGYLFGLMFVVMSWALEGATKSTDELDKIGKPHVRRLAAALREERWDDGDPAVRYLAPRQSMWTWWNLSYIAVLAAAAALGVALLDYSVSSEDAPVLYALPFVVASVAAAAIRLDPNTDARRSSDERQSIASDAGRVAPDDGSADDDSAQYVSFHASTGVGLIAAVTLSVNVRSWEPWAIAAIPAVIVFTVYVVFRVMTYDKTHPDFRPIPIRVRHGLANATSSAVHAIFGSASHENLFDGRSRHVYTQDIRDRRDRRLDALVDSAANGTDRSTLPRD